MELVFNLELTEEEVVDLKRCYMNIAMDLVTNNITLQELLQVMEGRGIQLHELNTTRERQQ